MIIDKFRPTVTAIVLSAAVGILFQDSVEAAPVQGIPIRGTFSHPQGPGLTPPTWLGDKKMAVILIGLQGEPYPTTIDPITQQPANPPLTYAQIHDKVAAAVFTASNSTNSYWENVSYRQFSVNGFVDPDNGDVFGPVDIPFPSTEPCDRDAWVPVVHSMLATQTAGLFDPANYDLIAYSNGKAGGCKSRGMPHLVPPGAFMDNFSLRATAHEMGHALGLSHSSKLQCTDSDVPVVFSDDWIIQEYGDEFDIMGIPPTMTYNQQKRGQLGWLSPTDTLTVTTQGTYDLFPIESFANKVKVLRVPRVSGPYGFEQYYYVELRHSGGFDLFGSHHALHNGTTLRLARGYDKIDRSYVLDAIPDTATALDAPFVPVSPTQPAVFQDPFTGTVIKTKVVDQDGGLDNSYAVVEITPGSVLTYSYGAPTAVLSTSSVTVQAGSTATFDVTVTNGDSADCPQVPILGTFTGMPRNWGHGALQNFEKTVLGAEVFPVTRTIQPAATAVPGQYPITLTVLNYYTGQQSTVVLTVTVT